jgi:hypothetical protein
MSGGKRGKGWTESEMILLCHSWLAVSEDSSVGTGQKAETFWGRVLQQMNQSLQEKDFPTVDKDWMKVQAKFGSISKDVSLFSGCYKVVIDLDESGKTDSDRLADAHALFLRRSHCDVDKRYAFKYLSCYNVLKDSPKWAQRNVKCKTPKKKRKTTSACSLSPTVQGPRLSEDAPESIQSDPEVVHHPGDTQTGRTTTGVRRAKLEKTKLHLQSRAVLASEKIAAASMRLNAQKEQTLQTIAANKTISLLLKTDPSSELARKLLANLANHLLKQQEQDDVVLQNVQTTDENEGPPSGDENPLLEGLINIKQTDKLTATDVL